MNKIYMLFENYAYRLIIVNVDSKLMSIEDKVFHIDENEAKQLLEILNSLSNDKNNFILDPVKFTIKIDKKEESTTFIGKSNTCSNFIKLSDWIGEMYDKYS